jgi:hypothetical protein
LGPWTSRVMQEETHTMPAHARNPPHKHRPAHLRELPALLSAPPALPPSTSLPQLRPHAWTALLATPPVVLALLLDQTALAALLASMLQLGPAPPALPPHTNLPQLQPLAWTALLATSPLALALLLDQTVLPVLLAVMLQLGPAPPALSPHTSLTLAQQLAWTALLATSPLALAQPSWLTALPALLASMLQLGPAPPALPPSTSLPQPRPPVWTALLASSPLGLAQPSWLTALAVLLGSISKLGPAPPVLSTSTSLSLAPPPAWSALLASSPMPLAQPSWLTALLALLASILQLESAPPVSSPLTSLPVAPPLAWTALLVNLLMALARPSWLSALPAPVGPSLVAPGPSPLATVPVQWLTLVPASKTQLGTLKSTRTAPSPSQGLPQ